MAHIIIINTALFKHCLREGAGCFHFNTSSKHPRIPVDVVVVRTDHDPEVL